MKAGSVARRVIDAAAGDEAAAAARAAIEALAQDPAVEVALLIFPSLTMTAAAFDAWCAPLRAAHAAFVAAVFHPDAPYELATPAQAVGLFRRAPDPTLQLVRQRPIWCPKAPGCGSSATGSRLGSGPGRPR